MDKGGQVREPQRRVQVAEVFEQPRPVGPRRELAVLFRREARADEVLHLSRLVDGGDHAVAGAGERTGAVNDLLQDGGQVETRVDAQDRGAERAQRLDLLPRFSGFVQTDLPPRTRRTTRGPPRLHSPCDGAIEAAAPTDYPAIYTE